MAKFRQPKNEQIIFGVLDDFVPQDHLVRKLEEFVDWDFIYDICDPLYSNLGKNRVDPVVLFKLMFINIIFDIHSMRKTCSECAVNIAYRWFLGIGMDEKIPDHSTFSQNYARKFKNNNVAIDIFVHIIHKLIDSGIVSPDVLYVDGTHLKANANKTKTYREEVEVAAKRYQKELDEEINADRKARNLKEFDLKKNEEPETKTIRKSETDPDCGQFCKGEKEKCLAYNINVATDDHGFVVGMSADPGNVHDSVAFFHLKDFLDWALEGRYETVVADAGYTTPGLCHTMLKEGKEYIVPKKRNAARKGFYGKYKYRYDRENDCYVCPLGVVLKYRTTTKNGVRQYTSAGNGCESCPNLSMCTKSQNHLKIIERHIWEDDKEKCIENWKSDEGREIYSHRKETVERTFADGKRRHGLDYTLYTGHERVYDMTILTFAGMNLKKYCLHMQKLKDKYAHSLVFEHQDPEWNRRLGLA